MPESSSIMLELASELESPAFSVVARLVHRELALMQGDSGLLKGCVGGLKSPLPLGGIMIPRLPPTVGDGSGDDCSASVEWCRFVAALEKSNPLARRGRSEVGLVNTEGGASNLGETGVRFVDKFAVLVLLTSLGGICKLRPLAMKLGRLGVTGLVSKPWSSLEDCLPSRKVGEGERTLLMPCADHGRLASGCLMESSGTSSLSLSPWRSPRPSWVI